MSPFIRNPFAHPPERREQWIRSFSEQGVVLSRRSAGAASNALSASVDGFVSQLLDEMLVRPRGDDFELSWDNYYLAIESGAYEGLGESLKLPAETVCRPSIRSAGSLTDTDFAVSIAGWHADGARLQTPKLMGAILDFGTESAQMQPSHWQLVTAVKQFAQRTSDQRTESHHREAWAAIRRAARNANAELDHFLNSSVVLAPERLTIAWRRSAEVYGVVEIEPSFDGAPVDWLAYFDRYPLVQDRYEIPTREGKVEVLVSHAVRTVLEEIKRFPGRRVAGSRAQAFLSNPFALLGDDAKDVLDEEQFEAAKESAGIHSEQFSPAIERDAANLPERIGVLVQTTSRSGLSSSETLWLSDAEVLDFVSRAQKSLEGELQFIAWNGFDLDVRGNTAEDVRALADAVRERSTPQPLIRYAEVYDLANYSSRIDGIGTERSTYSPYVTRKNDDEGWFPENVQPLIVVTTADGGSASQVVVANDALLDDIRRATNDAERAGHGEFNIEQLPEPMRLADAKRILTAFDEVSTDIRERRFAPDALVARVGKAKRLLLKANIATVDYEEARSAALASVNDEPTLPSSLLATVTLLPHQRAGIAWLQHLFRLREAQFVRGAVLADDMGLGKTLQLLAFVARMLEENPKAAPVLIVAPVALLENWAEETTKFFASGALPLLLAYGASLSALRIPKTRIDPRLITEDGLDKFLKPNWVGEARIVLTTYDTLRDYEFGFARQQWSVMICDEAQKIKNPAAMVTRSAKKQHVQFKIACTGTPVENALVDLWCLFDFVQPGLLGALNTFGHLYSKPIEAKTPEQRSRVEELRQRIDPQILRRTKQQVARDLPAKRIVDECRSLPISAHQRGLYAKALDDFRRRNDPGPVSPFKNSLRLLHYLRAICTDPQRFGQSVFTPEDLSTYRAKAPKLDWLLRQLTLIEARGEKVIVFCEFREIQRLLQHYIRESTGVVADIINGDTTASSESDVSRQKRIKAFQAKPGFGVIILSPLAVGFGVNIQGANHVVHYSRTWNPAKEDQATDRAYRIGQTREVFVYYPTVTAPDFITFDAKLDMLLKRKRDLAADMLNGSGDITFGDFSLDELAPTSSKEGLNERVTIEIVHRLTPQLFEQFVAVLWTKMGFRCHVTQQSGDQGIDVVAIRNDEGILLQAKSSGIQGNRLNADAIREVVTGAAFYRRQFPGVSFRTGCVTNRLFNVGARQHAELNEVKLYDQDSLRELLQKYAVMEADVEQAAFSS